MMTTRSVTTSRNRDANVITAVLAVPCALACAGSVSPGLDDIVTAAVVLLGVLVMGLFAARWIRRWLRERREDAEDALTAARWRAANAPHLLTDADRALLGAPAPETTQLTAEPTTEKTTGHDQRNPLPAPAA